MFNALAGFGKFSAGLLFWIMVTSLVPGDTVGFNTTGTLVIAALAGLAWVVIAVAGWGRAAAAGESPAGKS